MIATVSKEAHHRVTVDVRVSAELAAFFPVSIGGATEKIGGESRNVRADCAILWVVDVLAVETVLAGSRYIPENPVLTHGLVSSSRRDSWKRIVVVAQIHSEGDSDLVEGVDAVCMPGLFLCAGKSGEEHAC